MIHVSEKIQYLMKHLLIGGGLAPLFPGHCLLLAEHGLEIAHGFDVRDDRPVDYPLAVLALADLRLDDGWPSLPIHRPL